MKTKLERIAEVAKEKPNEKFTSLVHLINEEMITNCHKEMVKGKAPGLDLVTKDEYEENLEENISNLMRRMKTNSYKPNPVLRKYIPKAGTDKKRPLGIPTYEDKLVQSAVNKILEAVYEVDFLDSSFGYRPKRSCHDALKALNHIIEKRNINYIVEADIKGFFDNVSHRWMITFLKHRIIDPKLIGLITKFLKAGVMEDNKLFETPEGTPQGGIISPILANIYLHYSLDLWFEKVVRKRCKGHAYMIRYADDFVCCFEYESEARMFYQALILRLKEFNLEVAEDKTKVLKFGRKVLEESIKLGKYKPETFDFLGFTHYCGKSRDGWFRVKRKTSKKKFRASLLDFKLWLKNNRHMNPAELMKKLETKLNGYYRYYGMTDNGKSLENFREEIRKYLFKWLNRRSQKKSFNWDKFVLFLKQYPIPRPKIYVNIYNIRSEISYIM